jgi:hypothetical protein
VRPGSQRDASANTRYAGVVYGVVTQNKDPDQLNRIKVRFPWLDKGDEEQSAWAQLLTPMEGKEFGWYTLPDIDDVVCVVFMHSDMNHPIILGGIWSKEDKPPEPNDDGKNNFRGYCSRSGHRVILDDSPKTKIVFSDMSLKLMVGVGEFDAAGTGPNKCEVYKPAKAGKTGISISSLEGTLEVSCLNGTLTMDAGKNIFVDVKTTTELQAGGNLSATGKTTKITAGATANYKGSPMYVGP